MPRSKQPGEQLAIGMRIREMRQERGITLTAFAEQIGISPTQLSRVERGISMPSFLAGAAIAQGLGVSAEDLAGDGRSQQEVNRELVAALVAAGMDREIAQDIQSAISTSACEQLWAVVAGKRTS